MEGNIWDQRIPVCHFTILIVYGMCQIFGTHIVSIFVLPGFFCDKLDALLID